MRTIALLTDFGTRDPYVASMKGVIASCSEARVVDLTHELEPQDVFAAAWFLATVWRWWPAGTVFVCVVDPGVGTARRIVAAEREGRLFLAPDNGLLTFVGSVGVAVERDDLYLPTGATTFHGRDRFAPVAAAVANGLALSALGPPVADLVRLDYEPPRYDCARAAGTIVSIDRFGNAITDIERRRLPFDRFALRVREVIVDRVAANYAEAGEGPFLIVGSTGHVEVSVTNASAAAKLQLERGDCVEIFPK